MSTQTTEKPVAKKTLNPVELVAYVVAQLATFAKVEGNDLRLALGKLMESLPALCPSHLGTAEERKAARPVFSSDKETRKAQMKAFDADKAQAKSVSRILFKYAKERGLGSFSVTYGAVRTSTGNLSFSERNTLSMKQDKVATVRL